jgi:hypothetical protein
MLLNTLDRDVAHKFCSLIDPTTAESVLHRALRSYGFRIEHHRFSKEAIELLQSHGLDVNARDKHGHTALSLELTLLGSSPSATALDSIQELLECGADFKARVPQTADTGGSMLHFLFSTLSPVFRRAAPGADNVLKPDILNQILDIIKFMQVRGGLSLLEARPDGATPIALAVRLKGDWVAQLIDAGWELTKEEVEVVVKETEALGSEAAQTRERILKSLEKLK